MSTCLQGRPAAGFAPDNSVDLREAFRHALRLIDLSEKAAAIQMGIDQAQLSRGLSGEGHLYLDRIPVLGVAFQRALVPVGEAALMRAIIAIACVFSALALILYNATLGAPALVLTLLALLRRRR